MCFYKEKFCIDVKNYEIKEKIGSGTFGNVYSVKEKQTEIVLAAKVFSIAYSDEAKKMIDNEIDIMIKLNNPTIIKFLGYSTQDFYNNDNYVIFMELSKNKSLHDFMSFQKIEHHLPKSNYNTIRQIILIRITRGLKYLHDHSIIHLDLKPANILLDENFHPRITDFGVSHYFGFNDSKTNKICGTPKYMAPEVIRSEDYGRSADIYSLGIIMYEITTELDPYPKKQKNYDLYNKVIYENLRPTFPQNEQMIKEPFKKLIEKCWSKNPQERPKISEIFNIFSNYKKNPDFLLDDVDLDQIESYIQEITATNDITDHYISKIDEMEKEISKKNEIIKELQSQITNQNNEFSNTNHQNSSIQKNFTKNEENSFVVKQPDQSRPEPRNPRSSSITKKASKLQKQNESEKKNPRFSSTQKVIVKPPEQTKPEPKNPRFNKKEDYNSSSSVYISKQNENQMNGKKSIVIPKFNRKTSLLTSMQQGLIQSFTDNDEHNDQNSSSNLHKNRNKKTLNIDKQIFEINLPVEQKPKNPSPRSPLRLKQIRNAAK